MAVVGYHADFEPNWKIGVSYQFPSLSVAGEGELSQTYVNNGAIDPPVNLRSMGTKARIPWKASVGVAYVDRARFRLAADVSTYGGFSYSDVEHEVYGEKLEHKSITNASVGGEYSWNDWLKFRMGFFSNYSSHPNPDAAKVKGQGDHVDMAGFAANAAFRSGQIEYTFGGYYVGGRGRSIQRVDQEYKEVTKVQNVFTMLVGTSYYF